VFGLEVHDARAAVQEDAIRQHEECAWPLFENGRERGWELFRDSYPKELHLDSQHT